MNNLILVAVFLVLFIAWKKFGPGHASSRAAVEAKLNSGALILDVRTPGEFASGGYPKARNIPLQSLGAQLEKLGAKTQSIVVYCASGTRSSQAVQMLRRAGFTDVVNAGGLGSMPR